MSNRLLSDLRSDSPVKAEQAEREAFVHWLRHGKHVGALLKQLHKKAGLTANEFKRRISDYDHHSDQNNAERIAAKWLSGETLPEAEGVLKCLAVLKAANPALKRDAQLKKLREVARAQIANNEGRQYLDFEFSRQSVLGTELLEALYREGTLPWTEFLQVKRNIENDPVYEVISPPEGSAWAAPRRLGGDLAKFDVRDGIQIRLQTPDGTPVFLKLEHKELCVWAPGFDLTVAQVMPRASYDNDPGAESGPHSDHRTAPDSSWEAI